MSNIEYFSFRDGYILEIDYFYGFIRSTVIMGPLTGSKRSFISKKIGLFAISYRNSECT